MEKDVYICGMKKLLSILSLLILFITGQEIMTLRESNPLPENKVVVMDNSKALSFQDRLHKFELSQSPHFCLFSSNRTQQGTESSERLFKTTTRLLEIFFLKEQNNLNKIEQTLSVTHILKFSSLRIRSGHWVYVLRKIII